MTPGGIQLETNWLRAIGALSYRARTRTSTRPMRLFQIQFRRFLTRSFRLSECRTVFFLATGVQLLLFLLPILLLLLLLLFLAKKIFFFVFKLDIFSKLNGESTLLENWRNVKTICIIFFFFLKFNE